MDEVKPRRSLLTRIRGAFRRCLRSLRQKSSRVGCSTMEERPPRVPRQACVGEEEEAEEEGAGAAPAPVPRLAWVAEEEEAEEEGAGAAPAPQLEEVQEVQLLEADWDLPEEERDGQLAHETFRSAAEVLWESLKPPQHEATSIKDIETVAGSDSSNAVAGGVLPDEPQESDASQLEHVPKVVRSIYQWLKSNTEASAEAELENTLLELILASPHAVVVTLLCRAPSCDREAVTMWRAMVSSSRTAEQVLLELLRLLEDWPLHSMGAVYRDCRAFLPLAATRALREILRLPSCPRTLAGHWPRFFVALLFQISCSTEQMPEEDDLFWRGCQEEGCPPTHPNRLAVLTLKALLCRVNCEELVLEGERRHVWETLLEAETQPSAMGLLARMMHRNTMRFWIAECIVELVWRKWPRWESPAMAFIVELLPCPALLGWHDQLLQLLPQYLRSKRRVMRLLGLRALVVLLRTHATVRKSRFLLPGLIELLEDVDPEVLGLTLRLMLKVLAATNREKIVCAMALQLAEMLLPLFEHDDTDVQLFSISLFYKAMAVAEGADKEPLWSLVHQGLFLLFFHLYDEKKDVAQMCWESLFQATSYLKTTLKQLLMREGSSGLVKYLLSEHRSRADEYLQHALDYLQSPHEFMREAAIRFLWLGGWYIRRRPEKLLDIYDALLDMTDDLSRSTSNRVSELLTLLSNEAEKRVSRFKLQLLRFRLRRAWRRLRSLR